MSKILIVGDSFAADWRLKSSELNYGWPTLLEQAHDVTNLAKGGVGEYKILRQIQSQNINDYHTVIVAHTSPSRCHTKQHPVHKFDSFHSTCDLLYSDIDYHSNRIVNLFNFSLRAAKNWFVYHYDHEYQENIYYLIRKEIDSLLADKHVIELKCFDVVSSHTVLDYSTKAKHNQGYANHFTPKVNKQIYNDIIGLLK
jgi:hypothetical protein